MNMVAGHMLLVLCFTATQFFFFTCSRRQLIGLLGIGTFAFGFAFTCSRSSSPSCRPTSSRILTAVYIQLAVAEEH